MKSVLIANPKGGAGKTTLSTNLAGHFANQGHHVTLCDLDRQQSALRWMAFRDPRLPSVTGYFAGNQVALKLGNAGQQSGHHPAMRAAQIKGHAAHCNQRHLPALQHPQAAQQIYRRPPPA